MQKNFAQIRVHKRRSIGDTGISMLKTCQMTRPIVLLLRLCLLTSSHNSLEGWLLDLALTLSLHITT